MDTKAAAGRSSPPAPDVLSTRLLTDTVIRLMAAFPPDMTRPTKRSVPHPQEWKMPKAAIATLV